MQEDDFYRHLLTQCQSTDLRQRLGALEELRQEEYLDVVESQFLLNRLNATTDWQEHTMILQLMNENLAPATDQSTDGNPRRSGNVHISAHGGSPHAGRGTAEEALALVQHLLQDRQEERALREVIVWGLPLWEERAPRDILQQLLANPDLCEATLDAWRELLADSIPLEEILPCCSHEEASLRTTAIKALQAAGPRPLESVLAALCDPAQDVRSAATYGCIALAEQRGGQLPPGSLLQALGDEYPPVRENILDALGKVPLHIPVEPVAAALTDATYYVRCAALETLSLMGECVPSSLYPRLQAMSGSDPSAQVRLRATRALLLLHGMQPPPLKIPVIDLTREDLEENDHLD